MQAIRVGVIGCGVIAPTHAACYRQHADVQLTWACDLKIEKAQALARKFEIPRVTTDFRQLLAAEDIDLVSICTDHASHSQIACEALAAGCHVVCEKALAHDTKGLELMVQAGNAHPNLVFSGIFQHRHEPRNQYIRNILHDGTFGKLLTAGMQIRCWRGADYYQADDWRGTWDKEGGAVLINQAIHYVDLLQWMMQGVKTVSGSYANLQHQDCMETEDTAVGALSFSNGALGIMEATSASHLHWEPSMQFHGTEGSMELRNDTPVKLAFRDPAVAERITEELKACNHKTEKIGKSYYGGGHAAQIADVLNAIRTNSRPYVTAQSAAHTVSIVLGLYESHRTEKTVHLPTLV